MSQDNVIDTPKIIHNKVSSNQSSNSKINDDVNSLRFVKDLVERKDFGDDSSISNLIKYVKELHSVVYIFFIVYVPVGSYEYFYVT